MRNISSMYAWNDPLKRSSIIPGAVLGAVAYMASLALRNEPAMHPVWTKVQSPCTVLPCMLYDEMLLR